jgi:hypothetical protein
LKIKILFFISILNISALSNAAVHKTAKFSKTAQKVSAKSNNPNSKLSTDIKFDGQTVGGKTQSPFESLAVIENEKSIDDLIGMRTNFTDRTKKAQGMR